MVKAIVEAVVLSGPLFDDYRIEVAQVPSGLSYLEAPWDCDDRSVKLPKSSGTLWFRVFVGDSETVIAHAVFAADNAVARCNSIDVDERHRRREIASHLYRCAACFFDAPVVPSGTTLPGGKLFWGSRTSIIC
jgi:hypothetical protein